MSLENLSARVVDPRLKAFVAAWDSVRGDHAVPRWRDLDVGAMKAVLPYIWAWRYDRETDVFTGKLAGEEILAVIGRGFRGAKAHEYYLPAQYRAVYDWSRRVVVDAVGVVIAGQVFRHLGSHATGERVGLPVATQGGIADTILGVTLFGFGEVPKRSIRDDLTFEPPTYFTLER